MQQSQFRNQQKYIDEQEKLINRFRAKASKAKMAQSRIKKLDKLERISDAEGPKSGIKINFNVSMQPGRIVSDLIIKSKRYGDQIILDNTKATVERGPSRARLARLLLSHVINAC